MRKRSITHIYIMEVQSSPNRYSARIQRAEKINIMEQNRLTSRLQVLENERNYYVRITSVDSKRTEDRLRHIQRNSGHSAKGLPPNAMVTNVRAEVSMCFLYGERLISRRFGKFRASLLERERERQWRILKSQGQRFIPNINNASNTAEENAGKDVTENVDPGHRGLTLDSKNVANSDGDLSIKLPHPSTLRRERTSWCTTDIS